MLTVNSVHLTYATILSALHTWTAWTPLILSNHYYSYYTCTVGRTKTEKNQEIFTRSDTKQRH